jgi:hypothetical protein
MSADSFADSLACNLRREERKLIRLCKLSAH